MEELFIDERFNKCSSITYLKAFKEAQTITNNLKLDFFPNVFNVAYMESMIDKKFHEIHIVNIMVKWDIISNALLTNDLDEDFEKMKGNFRYFNQEQKLRFLNYNSKMLLLLFGTKIITEDKSIYEDPEVIAVEYDPLFFTDKGFISNAFYELETNYNIHNKESVEQELFLRIDFYQKSKELRKIVLEDLFPNVNPLMEEFIVNGCSLKHMVIILDVLDSIKEEKRK